MSRDKKVNIALNVKDGASRALKGMKKNLLSIKSVIGAGIGFIGLKKAITEVAKAAGEQEDAIHGMNKQLEINNELSKENSNLLQTQARSLQRVTKFGDEEILRLQTTLLSFGVQAAAVDSVVKSTLDLSTALGIELKNAGILMGRAFTGSTETLSRYGLTLREGLKDSEKFAELQRIITERFGGRAQAEAETFTGKLKQMDNVYGDLKESVGFFLTTNESARRGLALLQEGLSAVIVELDRKREADDRAAKAARTHNDAVDLLDDGIEKLGKSNILLAFQRDLEEAAKRTSRVQKELEDVGAADILGVERVAVSKRLTEALTEQADIQQKLNNLLKDENITKGFQEFLKEAAQVKLEPQVDIFRMQKLADDAYTAFKNRFEANARSNPPAMALSPTVAPSLVNRGQ